MVRGRARRQRARGRHRRIRADGRPHAGAGRQAGARARPPDGRDGDRGRRLRPDARPRARHVRRALGADAGVPAHRHRALAGPPGPARRRLQDAARQGPGAGAGEAVARDAAGRAGHRRRRDEQRPGRDGAAAGRGRPAQRRAGAAGARPDARRGELANDRAGAPRAPAVRPQEAARCAGGAARGGAGAARPRADGRRAPARRPGERGHAPGQDDRALASVHGQGRQAGDGAGRGRRRRPGGAQRRGRGGGDRAHPARGGRDAGPDGGAGHARPPAGAARRRQARGVGLEGRRLGRPAVRQDRRRRAARSHDRSRGQALRAGGAGLAPEASALPARHAGGRAAPRRARARARGLPHALLRPGARRRGGGAGAGARRHARGQAPASRCAQPQGRRLAGGAQAGEGAGPGLPALGGAVSVLGQVGPVHDRQGPRRGGPGAGHARQRRAGR